MNRDPILGHLRRGERRSLLKNEAKARKAGAWGPWEKLTFPRGTVGSGWSRDFDTAYRNAVFSVLVRKIETGAASGSVIHLAISSLSGERPTWWEAQRIKNDLCGEDTTAIEVYPPQSQVVDGADMFHLWVLPAPLNFGLATKASGQT